MEQTEKLNNLRKCRIRVNVRQERYHEVYYFHKWVESGEIKRHPEDPQKDTTYVATYALIEDVESGQCEYAEPNRIIFI
jgi:hypothetical protein